MHGIWRHGASGLGAFGGLLPGLTESIAFAVELDDLSTFGRQQSRYSERWMRRSTRVPLACASLLGDDAGGGGEHVGPFGEGFIGRDEDGHGEVPAGDDLSERRSQAVGARGVGWGRANTRVTSRQIRHARTIRAFMSRSKRP